MESMDKFQTQFLNTIVNPNQDPNIIRLLVDKNIDNKLDNRLENIESMNKEIINNNLILGNDNSVDL